MLIGLSEAPAVEDEQQDLAGAIRKAEDRLARHIGRLGNAHGREHGRGDVTQAAALGHRLRVRRNGSERDEVGRVRHMRLALVRVHDLEVAVVGADQHGVPGGARHLQRAAELRVYDAGTGDLRLVVGGVADHVAVCKVGDDEVIAVLEPVGNGVYHAGQAQAGHGIERHALGGGNAHVVLARERLLVTAVEEEGHVGKLFAFGAVQLRLAGFGEHLRERVPHLGGRERDGQIGVFLVIHREDYEVERRNPFPLESGEVRVGERIGQLDLALAAAAAEDDRIAGAHRADGGAVGGLQIERLKRIVRSAAAVGLFDRAGKRLAAVERILFHDKTLLFSMASSRKSGAPGNTSSSWSNRVMMPSGWFSSVSLSGAASG